MNILLTGATGFIGNHLIDQLIKEHQLFVIVKESFELNFRDDLQTFLFEDHITELSIWINECKIDGVIHLASLFLAQHKSEDIKPLIDSNVFFGTVLMEALRGTQVKWFINTGTIWQNSIPDSKAYSPVNLYAATKQAFISVAEYYSKVIPISFVTLKLCDTFGKNDPRKKIFNLFKQITLTGETLNMSPGEQIMDILYIDDVVSGFLSLVQQLQTNSILEKEYVLTSQKRYPLKELAAIFSEVTGKPMSIHWGAISYRPNEVMIPWEKGIVLPQWTPEVDIYNGIKMFMEDTIYDK